MFRFIKLLFSLMPDLTGFKELGFSARSRRGQLFVERITEFYTVRFCQGHEPDGLLYRGLIDFVIPDGFIAIEFAHPLTDGQREVLSNEGRVLFRFHERREQTFFFFDPRLDFSTPQVGVKLEKLIQIIDKALKY